MRNASFVISDPNRLNVLCFGLTGRYRQNKALVDLAFNYRPETKNSTHTLRQVAPLNRGDNYFREL